LDVIETTIGASPKLQIRTGSPPANCAAADSGTLLVEIALDSDWAAAASSGSKAFQGLPDGATASNTGTAGHYRVKDNAGTTTHMQGTVGTSGTDLIIDNTSVTSGQTVNLVSWSITDGNA
jgi:hypothetical protein